MSARAIVFGAVLALAAAAATAAPPAYVTKAVADATRPADDTKLDAQRLPAEVLAFSGGKPGQSVGEFLPGGGYYTRMLSDIVGPKGKVYALETTVWGKDNIESTKKAVDAVPLKNVSLDLAGFGQFALPEKVDLFFTSLNYHDLHVAKYGQVDMAAFNKHVFDSVKPGGAYVILDHAANPGTDDAAIAKVHRIEKAQVIKEVTAAGFRLEGESAALAHPADDHTKNVFDPTVRYKTDQFLLKFRKPA
jgi:predicted methyltransferase